MANTAGRLLEAFADVFEAPDRLLATVNGDAGADQAAIDDVGDGIGRILRREVALAAQTRPGGGVDPAIDHFAHDTQRDVGAELTAVHRLLDDGEGAVGVFAVELE